MKCILHQRLLWKTDFSSLTWRQSRGAEHINMPIALKTKNIAHVAWAREAAEASIRQTLKGAEAATGHEDQIKDGEKEREMEGARGRGNRGFKNRRQFMEGSRAAAPTGWQPGEGSWLAIAQHKRPLCVRSDPLSAFDGPVFTSSSGSNVLEIDIYGLREGVGGILFLDHFSFFTPFFPPVAFFSPFTPRSFTQRDIHVFLRQTSACR